MNKVEDICVQDLEELSEIVMAEYERIQNKDEVGDIDVVGFYDEIKVIAETLVMNGFGIHMMDLDDENSCGYAGEYVLGIIENEIYVEKAKWEGHDDYILIGGDVVFVMDGCNSRILKRLESDEVYVVSRCDNCDHHDFEDEFEYDDVDLHEDHLDVGEFELERLLELHRELNDLLEIFGL